MARTKDFDESDILNKAVNLFWLKGYNATSMQDLVDGLGISRSSLYDTYGDKHTLFIKALENYRTVNTGRQQQIIDNSASARDGIRQLLEYIVNGLLDDKSHKGCFIVNAEVEVAPHDYQVSQLIGEHDQQMEDLFYQIIYDGQQNGEISSAQSPRALARFIFNNVKGIRVTAKSTNDRAIFDDIIKMAVSVLD